MNHITAVKKSVLTTKWAASSGGTDPTASGFGFGAPMRWGTINAVMPAAFHKYCELKTIKAIPIALAKAVDNHQTCRGKSSAVAEPGTSGGKPRAGKRENARKPETPQPIPSIQPIVRP